jgi:hypothetical protein
MGPAKVGPIALLFCALAACAPPPQTLAPPAVTPSPTSVSQSLSGGPTSAPSGAFGVAESTGRGAELAAVTDILTDLQFASFAANAEHCGYIGLDPVGQIILSPVNRGTEDSCLLPYLPAGMTVLASFHTHGTYSPDYASEWPTTADMLTDAADGIDGYISTPGGRLWYVDTDTMTVRELCGRGCLPQDPRYRPAEDGPLRPVMSLEDLRRWENG